MRESWLCKPFDALICSISLCFYQFHQFLLIVLDTFCSIQIYFFVVLFSFVVVAVCICVLLSPFCCYSFFVMLLNSVTMSAWTEHEHAYINYIIYVWSLVWYTISFHYFNTLHCNVTFIHLFNRSFIRLFQSIRTSCFSFY